MNFDPPAPSETPAPESVDDVSLRMERARRLLPYGNLDSILQRPMYFDEDRAFPQFVRSCRGYELTDTLGNTLIDWVNAGGPVLLGYRHPEVERAIVDQLACGPTLSMMHPLEVDVAQDVVDMVPCAEMVAFGKNGSDGLTAAVRASRAITGKQKVVQHGMHGFHDWYVVQNPDVRGAPAALADLIHEFPYNDLDALEAQLEAHRGEVAAVVMEPVREQLPDPGYMEGVLELTHRHGALLVFDEVVTAFRLAPGGAQTFLGVEPDFACLGKALGNGMPISALVGPRRHMEHVASVAFGMTFRGETLTLAAAQAVLRILRTDPVHEHIAAIGERIRGGFESACERHGVRSRLSGPAARMTFGFEDQGGRSWKSLQDLFVQACLRRGVFTNGNILPSYAHDDRAVESSLGVFDEALAEVAEAIAPRENPEEAPHARVAIGFLESLDLAEGTLSLSGWMLLPGFAPDRMDLRCPDGEVVPCEAVLREDLGDAYPGTRGASRGGFRLSLPAPWLDSGEPAVFWLRAWAGERLAFVCRIRVTGEGASKVWLGDGVVNA